MEWKSKQITHEGFPLLLRYPKSLAFRSLRQKFQKLLVLSHSFSKVSPNGLPDPDYNESLFPFDGEIRKRFELSRHGVTVLIETFAGKRNYYIHADSKANADAIVTRLREAFPNEHLSLSFHADARWSFIRKYSREFLND